MRVKQIFSVILVIAISFFNSSLSFADMASQELKQKLLAISDMQAQFKQQVINEKGEVIQSSDGQMWVKKPQLFRWQVAEPYSQIIVANKTHVWLYDQDLEQAVVRNLQQQISNVPALLISGNVQDLDANYDVKKLKDSKGLETFVLKPLAQDALFVELQASFSGDQLATMRLVDNLGQFTHIAFSHIKLNQNIGDEVFTLVLPESVDIIREGKVAIDDHTLVRYQSSTHVINNKSTVQKTAEQENLTSESDQLNDEKPVTSDTLNN